MRGQQNFRAALKIAAAAVLLFIAFGLYNPLAVEEITVCSGGGGGTVRIALVSDLHSCAYGEGQAELLAAIEGGQPDLICLCGDIFDDRLPDENTERFLAGIGGRYPCFYVTGNHEYRAGEAAFQEKMAVLERYGITRLACSSTLLEVRGRTIAVCGVDDPMSPRYSGEQTFADALADIRGALPDGTPALLLSHRPELFPLYAACGYDLALCGHAHGGQWRIPVLLENGLIAPGQGLFPLFTNGKYSSGDSAMVVSRGLARESTRVPRFCNMPEIVMISWEQNGAGM